MLLTQQIDHIWVGFWGVAGFLRVHFVTLINFNFLMDVVILSCQVFMIKFSFFLNDLTFLYYQLTFLSLSHFSKRIIELIHINIVKVTFFFLDLFYDDVNWLLLGSFRSLLRGIQKVYELLLLLFKFLEINLVQVQIWQIKIILRDFLLRLLSLFLTLGKFILFKNWWYLRV